MTSTIIQSFLKLYNAIEVDKRSAITLSAIDKKEFSLSECELDQIKQETAYSYSFTSCYAKNKFLFWLSSIGDSRIYISPLNTASVILQPGEGILSCLYADFDSTYSECLKHTKKTCPTRQVLIFPYWPKKKKLYYYLTLIETQKDLRCWWRSLFAAEFLPIFPLLKWRIDRILSLP